jgi:hypothetical protein
MSAERPAPPSRRPFGPFGPFHALAIIVAAATIAHVAYYFPRVVDDLFISLRYAENFAHGRGIVFNVGERVEGYSSPLWMFLQSIGFLFRAEGVTWTKLLGLASLAAIQIGLYRFGREVLKIRPLVALLPCVFTAGNSYLIDWAVLGLETPAHLALIVWTPVVLRRATEQPTWRRVGIAAAVAIGLGTVRPEAPMYLIAFAVAEMLEVRALHEVRKKALASLRVWAIAGTVLLLLLLARKAYFGLWFPHTYYVKGSDVVFDLARLKPLYEQGVAPAEELVYAGGLALAVLLALFRRALQPLLVCVAAMYFTAKVETDWMPSLRHLLPFTVFATIPWAWAVDGLWSAAKIAPPFRARFRGVALAAAVVLPWGGWAVAQVDVRFSPKDKHGNDWALPKRKEKWTDTVLSMLRKEPPHITAMGPFEMGMITQNYRLYEASALPMEESWYIGRDIGKVGYYSDAKIYDTAGLFTPDLTQSKAWRTQRVVDDALIEKAMSHRPVAGELYEEWTPALGRRQDLLRGYDVVVGYPAWPVDIVASDRGKPSSEEILRRYRKAADKFPQWFLLNTLYGECVGGAIRKRLRILEENLSTEPPPAPGEGAGAGVTIDGAVETLGCKIDKARAKPGDEVSLRCFYKVLRPLPEPWSIFVHVEDARGAMRVNADHPPVGGMHPTRDWKPGEIVRDATKLGIPKDEPAGTLRIWYGLWRPGYVPRVEPASKIDPKLRIPGPTIQVER